MNLIINGENHIFHEHSTILEIIEQLQVKDKVMACAVNMEIIKKEHWENFIPRENDTIELLQFVGGG